MRYCVKMSQYTSSVKMFGDSVDKWCIVFLIIFALTKDCVEAQDLKSPAVDFGRHSIVQPSVQHARTKRELSNTRDEGGAHHSEVTVKVPLDGEEYILELKLNEDLISEGHVLRYKKNGKTVLHKPKKEDLDLCQYSGSVKGKPGSWAAVSTCNGIRGVIFDGKQMRYIEPAQDDIQSQHYIYNHSDLKANYQCGYVGGVTNNTKYDPELMKKYQNYNDLKMSRISRHKRSTDDTQVRGPYNANKLTRYVELVLVVDNMEFIANREDIRTVHKQMKDVANIINSVYAPLNIFIALVGVVVWTEGDEIQLVENGDTTLNNFLHYRRNTLVTTIPNDNAHLLTRQKFQDGVVGKALKGPICTYEFSGGVATNHSEVIGLVATTIAHEMGHNFGMEHDTEEDCECPDEKCIMSPSSTSVTPVHWSSCSLKSLALAFEKGMDYCLRNKPKRLFESPTCGNGFVEPGEQCDCGLSIKHERNACHGCCNPETCMLRSNASCGAGTCCDFKTCRPKSAGTECRSADRECDLPEYCTGHSEFCPRDVYKMDTTPCGTRDQQAYCVKGSCRSHTDQCLLLWGTTGESSHEKCYTNTNIKGNKNGNCGYDRIKKMYKPCAPADAMCGMLQCRHLNERLEFGMESVALLSAMFINNNGTIIPCRTAIIDLGLNETDPGMVPDGAKCGHEMMCLKQRCVPVKSVRAEIARWESSVCPSNCSGHGVCNSEGHCHCEAGFSPPLCATPGAGGSYESGPVTDPSIQRNFMVAMYIIFLGIIPGILLLLFLIYYSRHNVLFWWKKPKKSYVNCFSCTPWKCMHKSQNNTFANRFARFKSSTSSLRKLLSFKRRNTAPEVLEIHYPKPDDHFDDTPENVVKTQPLHYKILDLADKDASKKALKKPNKKINKDDIQIADGSELIPAVVLEKPKLKENKPNVSIIKQGLASTTNESIVKEKSNLYNIVNTSEPIVTHSKENKPNVSVIKHGSASTKGNAIQKNINLFNGNTSSVNSAPKKSGLIMANKNLAQNSNVNSLCNARP